MITKEQILKELEERLNEDNKDIINTLINRVKGMEQQEINDVLKENKIRTIKGIKKFVDKKEKEARKQKFTELNELVSYGVNGKTIHIHVIPEDARSFLTKEGQKKAELALIDATEKIKELIKTEPKYTKIKVIYAVSDIIHGVVSRWFKNIGYDVKTLPIEKAKRDIELRKFYKRFQHKKKLGRATLDKRILMSEEWETMKNARKQELESSIKSKGITSQLKDLNATDSDMLQHEETIKTKESLERPTLDKE